MPKSSELRKKFESIQRSCCDYDKNELYKSVRKLTVATLEKNKLNSCSNTMPDTKRVRHGSPQSLLLSVQKRLSRAINVRIYKRAQSNPTFRRNRINGARTEFKPACRTGYGDRCAVAVVRRDCRCRSRLNCYTWCNRNRSKCSCRYRG